jgi:hypothetical protein
MYFSQASLDEEKSVYDLASNPLSLMVMGSGILRPERLTGKRKAV